jgi:CRP-like cAMP-binding protein
MLGDSMFVLGEGTVRLSARSHSGEDVVLGELGKGAWMGEVALLKQGPRMCTATALTTVAAVELRYADFQRLLGTKPQACAKLLMRIVTAFGDKVRDNREALRSLVGRI